MKPIGVLRFHGTNCDQDVYKWASWISSGSKLSGKSQVASQEVEFVKWIDGEENFNPKDFSALLIPGGFSYGDYLRCGALAARSPAMENVHEFAYGGGFVLGICNGFQILCESGLLPGSLLPNESGRFRDDFVNLRVNSNFEAFPALREENTLRIPIAHGEGRFVIDDIGLQNLQKRKQIWLRYTENPNGSVGDIAGICNEKKNVFGLMPHPERAYLPWMDSEDGGLFRWKSYSKNIG